MWPLHAWSQRRWCSIKIEYQPVKSMLTGNKADMGDVNRSNNSHLFTVIEYMIYGFTHSSAINSSITSLREMSRYLDHASVHTPCVRIGCSATPAARRRRHHPTGISDRNRPGASVRPGDVFAWPERPEVRPGAAWGARRSRSHSPVFSRCSQRSKRCTWRHGCGVP